MKKTLILFVALFSIGFTKANPIVPPPIISEFYIVNDSTWYLELLFWRISNNPLNIKITSSSGSSLIKHPILLTSDSLIVLTQDSLKSYLHFNRNGDYIIINDSMGYSYDRLYFGNIPNSRISAPLIGQSIVNMANSCWDTYENAPWTEYILVKDNHPTIGFNAFKPIDATGTFKGIVYDRGHKPVPGIYIGRTSSYYHEPSSVCGNYFKTGISDSSGKFNIEEYSVNYSVKLFFKPSKIWVDSTINIEPDSINYYEFTIDSLLIGIKSNNIKTNFNLACFPNPTTGVTTISFTLPEGRHYSKALIKIYDSNGEIVRILPVNTYDFQQQYMIKWDGLCFDNNDASGIYYCKLELNGQKVATNKIIIAK
jgi:hypothetical protein